MLFNIFTIVRKYHLIVCSALEHRPEPDSVLETRYGLGLLPADRPIEDLAEFKIVSSDIQLFSMAQASNSITHPVQLCPTPLLPPRDRGLQDRHLPGRTKDFKRSNVQNVSLDYAHHRMLCRAFSVCFHNDESVQLLSGMLLPIDVNMSDFISYPQQLKKIFTPTLPGKCLPYGPINWLIAGVSIATDCFVFFSPLYPICKTQLRARKKWQLGISFALGLVTTLFSALRMSEIPVVASGSGDSTMLVLWSCLEMNVGVREAYSGLVTQDADGNTDHHNQPSIPWETCTESLGPEQCCGQ